MPLTDKGPSTTKLENKYSPELTWKESFANIGKAKDTSAFHCLQVPQIVIDNLFIDEILLVPVNFLFGKLTKWISIATRNLINNNRISTNQECHTNFAQTSSRFHICVVSQNLRNTWISIMTQTHTWNACHLCYFYLWSQRIKHSMDSNIGYIEWHGKRERLFVR